jgi:hypothetical protein
MVNPVLARRLILMGLSVSATGIILYYQLGRIVELRMGLTVLNTATILSLSMTVLGLLTVFLTWAFRAPVAYALFSGISLGAILLLVAEFVNISFNIHGPSAILLFAGFAALLGCIMTLVIAAVRFALSRRRRHT